MQRVVFGKTGWAIDFSRCEDVVAGLQCVFNGWDIGVGFPAEFPDHQLRAIIRRTTRGWHWQELGFPKARDWDLIPPQSVMRVITDVHDAAIYWHLDDNPHLLCLHGGAVILGSSLVCFPARGRAGKSTLVASFAAIGRKIYADDVLALEAGGNRGRALGFMPRLRAPLPGNIDSEVRHYINQHLGPASHGWIYLRPKPRQMAAFGEVSKIGAFVLLERQEHGDPELEPLNTAAILKILIAENIIRKLPMSEIFDRLHLLASQSKRYTLRYSSPLAAAKFLSAKFA